MSIENIPMRPMTAYIHIVIGVLSVIASSFSLNLNCTKLTTSCPTAVQWSERGKLFNCPGNKKYVCLMAAGNELREGCIFNSTIQAGRTGCPYTKQCDSRTGQPLLLAYQDYLPCPPDHNGCPPRNHPGYSILEIYKYARCQGRDTSDISSVSPKKVTGAPTTTTPDKILPYENWTLNTLSIALGLLLIFFVICLVFREKYKGRSEYQSLGIMQAENNLYRENKCTINQEQLAEMGAIPHELQHLLQIKDNSSPDTAVETELPNFTIFTKKIVSKKKDQQHLLHTHSSSSEDSYSSQTSLLPDKTQQTYFSLSSQKPQPEPSFIVSEKDTQLYQAASDGDIETLKKLIDAKADVNAKAFFQDTPLHIAASNGHIDIVKILIDARADVNAKDLDHYTPLHRAASNGHSDTVKKLIDANADVNAWGKFEETPLHRAALNGTIDTVKILIDANVEVNARNRNEETPLQKAAFNGHTNIVKILIDAKADANAKDSNLFTPLHLAAFDGHSDIVRILIDVNADVNAIDRDQDTPLHIAALNGHIDIVKILIDGKADVNAMDWYQDTPLHMAASNGHVDIVTILIDGKADVNAMDWKQDTPLHTATLKSHSDTVRILIDAKSDVNAKGMNQFTPLQIAALNGYSDTVKILIEAKADVNAIGWMRNTPLHSAAFKGHSDIVRILIDAKSDVNAKGSNQDTPLHKAASNGHNDIVRMLIDAKSDVNAKGWYKNTPLHEAARCGRFGIIRFLLTSAADFSIRNIDGKTAEELGNPKSKKVFRDCFEKIPREIKRLGVDAIRHFLRSLNGDAVPVNVVSFMLFGHDGVGKTTLLNSFLGLPRKKTKVANGIDLHMGKIFANINTDEQTDKITGQNDFTQINVWDFAGKMMYYTMHLEHLSPRRLYFLVFNASLGLDGMVDDPSVDPSDNGKIFVLDYIDFWVTTITTYVQSDVRGFPRIALVGTHNDKISDTLKISKIIEEIKIKFQPLVDTGQLIILEDLFINALYMNAETTRKLSEIILSCGKSYPEYGQMIPRSWNDLHQKLILRKSEIVIAFDQLDQMNSHMEKPLNEKELTLCIQYFHNLGYFLFFPGEEMKDHVVLDPRWVTNAMLHFITCSNQTSNSGEQKWLQMHTTGKIEKAQLDEVLLEKNAEASYGNYLHRVVKKLDLVSEPKVYNSEGFEECQNYFYMPCIVNREISSDALSLFENQEAVQVSFSFSTVIPPAVYNRLVASSLSLWPVFNGHIYNGLIILRSGPLHLISFRREYTKINISVVHLQDRRHINVCLCRTIVQFVEQRLTWILSTYNTSTVERKSLFNITYNSAAAEILKDRKIEKGEHGQCEGCQESRKRDVTQENYEPDDLFLMRVASRLTDNDIYPLAAKVYNHERFADDLQSEYTELGKSDIAWLILMEWKRQAENKERTPKVTGLRLVLHQARINPHIFCKVMNQKDEYPFFLDPDYLETDVHSELLHAVADRISSKYIHVGLELGLKADDILKLLKNFKGRAVGLIRAMLQEWYDKNKKKGHVKVVKLVTALLNAKSDISVFYEFEKQRFHARY